MADESQQYVIKTDGGDFRILADKGMPQDQVLRLAAATNPNFALHYAQSQASQVTQDAAAKMQPSKVAQLARGTTAALPVLGGAAGGALTSPGVVTTAVGAGLGAAGGKSAELGINKAIFGDDETAPQSKEGLKQTAISGAEGTGMALGASALESALGAIPLGKFILNKVVKAKDPRQIGNAMEAFMEAKPAGMTRKMLMRDLESAHTAASKAYGEALQSITTPVNVDRLMSPVTAEAIARDAKVPGVAARVEKLLEAAKMKAGINGPTATAEQLATLKNVVRKVAYRSTDDPIALATNDVMKMADHAAGGHIRAMSPEAAEALDSMTNMHAARSALRNYKPGKAASIAISAAMHPTAARIIAPAAAVAGAVGGKKLVHAAERGIAALP